MKSKNFIMILFRYGIAHPPPEYTQCTSESRIRNMNKKRIFLFCFLFHSLKTHFSLHVRDVEMKIKHNDLLDQYTDAFAVEKRVKRFLYISECNQF